MGGRDRIYHEPIPNAMGMKSKFKDDMLRLVQTDFVI